uniref:Uncharacterized protein n=1 Tax=Monopterus albus TaxID=43700 RepID=A0A3Q3IQ36_MONAL
MCKKRGLNKPDSSFALTGGSKNRNYDLSGTALTDLYNSRVQHAERVERPMGSSSSSSSFSLVTLEDGSQYLVHKGRGYGDASDTVVTDARHMSSFTKHSVVSDTEGERTVSDFVHAGGEDYRLTKANCHQAAKAMMNQ